MVGHPHNAVHSRSDFIVYHIQEFALGLAGGLGSFLCRCHLVLLLKTKMNPEQDEYVKMVKTSADLLLTTVRDLRKLFP